MMRYVLLLVLFGWTPTCVAQEGSQESSASDNAQQTLSPEQSVLEAIRSYVDAFNRRDAAAISQHWSETGEYFDTNGNLISGRDKIRQAFESLFAEMPEDQVLSVTVNRIALVTANVAMEEGSAETTDGLQTDYVAIHKLENGDWNLFSVRESERAAPPSHYQHLQELEWMIGDWVDQGDEGTVESSCRWSKNQNFITKNFKVSIPGMDPLEGTQVIGYDASTGTIRSWLFDSDGGIGEGTWTRKNGSWEVRSSQVLADGRTASAVNMFTPLNENEFTFKSIGREVDGEFMPNTDTVTVVRVTEETSE